MAACCCLPIGFSEELTDGDAEGRGDMRAGVVVGDVPADFNGASCSESGSVSMAAVMDARAGNWIPSGLLARDDEGDANVKHGDDGAVDARRCCCCCNAASKG